MEDYDVVIVGAGIGGLALGCALASNGRKTCVLEARPRITPSKRGLTLQPNGLETLQRLGLLDKVDRNGNRTSYAYDALNRVTAITYTGTMVTSDTYSYDAVGNLLTLQSRNATLGYSYDARNRVTCETYKINGGMAGGPCGTGGSGPGYSFSYTYQGDVMNSTVYNDGLSANYYYDGLGRVATVTIPVPGHSSGSFTFSYFQNDQLKGIQYPSGYAGNWTYDKMSRPSTITMNGQNGQVLSLTYGYNNSGTVLNVVGQVNGTTVNERYHYDPVRRLTNATVQSQGTTTNLWYQYDYSGNMMSQNLNNALTSYKYNSTNQELTSWSSPPAGTNTVYSYDKNGNLLTKKSSTPSGTTTWNYNWDVTGRLLKVTNNASGVQGYYAYDGLGRRVATKEGSTTTYYAYSGTETLSDGLGGTGSTTYDYIYADGHRIARVSNGGSYPLLFDYYHADEQGSLRLVTSGGSGFVTYSGGYRPFGQDNGTPTGSQTYKFTGKPVSATTGLYYYFHRWYDPSIGRFISPDPKQGHLSNPQSLNLYIYVVDKPTTLTDPSGKGFLDAVGAFLSPIVKSVANTVNQLESAAVALTTKVVNAVASATINTAKTLVTASVQLAKGAVVLGQTTCNALVGPIMMGTYSAGGSASSQGDSQGGGSGGTNPADTLNNLLDVFDPCTQVILGPFLLRQLPSSSMPR